MRIREEKYIPNKTNQNDDDNKNKRKPNTKHTSHDGIIVGVGLRRKNWHEALSPDAQLSDLVKARQRQFALVHVVMAEPVQQDQQQLLT